MGASRLKSEARPSTAAVSLDGNEEGAEQDDTTRRVPDNSALGECYEV